MQAPHRPVPQPYLVPVSLSPSRSTHSNGVCGGASVEAGLPLTENSTAIVSSSLPPTRLVLGLLPSKHLRRPPWRPALWSGHRGLDPLRRERQVADALAGCR